jgi:hypothetical protein
MSRFSSEIKEMSTATQRANNAIAAMSRSASRLSSLNTSTLYGTAGGFLGMGIAYILSLAFPISLTAVSIILTSLGVVGGILFYRGLKRVDLEGWIESNRLAADEILRRIKQLPKDAPQQTRDEMWLTYQALNSRSQFPTMVTIADSSRRIDDTLLIAAQPPSEGPPTRG